MLNFLQPIKNASPYKQFMMAALHALRKQANLLLNTMDVFIQEPLLDWQVIACCYLLLCDPLKAKEVLIQSAVSRLQ